MKNTQKKVTCRPGKVLPNHFSTKAEAMRVGKKYAMEAGAEFEVLNKTQTQNKQTKNQKKASSK